MARFSNIGGGGGGVPGPQGPQGDSAYEIAVDNGFTGTEQEWLDSLAADADLIVPVSIKDESNQDFVTITKTGTGTARIATPQDDLSLRSARDITLFAGSDGPGNVYIGWGDAVYTPDSPNKVATIGDITDSHGNITFEGVKVIGAGEASGDGYGNGTIEVVPDADLYNNHQYLVIDPTAPNHIHIRAGGTQDASNAELILGAEQTNVKVTDYNHTVGITTYNAELDSMNFWYFQNDGTLAGPGMGNLLVYGIYGSSSEYPLPVASNDKVLLNGNNGEFLNDPDIPANQIATIGDINSVIAPTKVRFSPVFQATGLTFTGSGATYPTYDSWYVKSGDLVTFNIKCVMTTVTNFGTGQFKLELPFAPLSTAANHFSAWCWVDPSLPADELNGHVQLVADHLPGSQTLDLHWLKETTASPKPLIESILSQGNPITLTTSSFIYVNGTYIAA